MFAAELVSKLTLLPVEEDERLGDPRLRENFIVRVFAYHRLRALFRGQWTIGDLVRFHTRKKLLLMAHEPSAQRELGNLLATAKEVGRPTMRERYPARFMRATATPAQPKCHANVLRYAVGYFKQRMDTDDRKELLEAIEEYRRGLVRLIVPLTLLRHHVRRHDVPYRQGQSFLEPQPTELRLRNHV